MNFDEKVMQIIPCCRQLYEVGTGDDGIGFRYPVVAFALIEDQYSNRRVIPLSVDGLGQLDNAEGHQIEEGGDAEHEAENMAD